MNITKEKIEEYTDYIKKAETAIARAKDLYSGLETWDKKVINKTFFEHYFTSHDENGEIRKDWKGKIITNFRLDDMPYDHMKGKRIHLAMYEYVDVDNSDTMHVCEQVKNKIASLGENIKRYKSKIQELESTSEDEIVKDIIAVWKKHGKPSIWAKILDAYEVQNPE